MSTDDNDAEYETTRRNAMKAGAGTVLIPLSHESQSWTDKVRSWFGGDDEHAGTGENVYVRVNEEVITEDTKAIDFQGYGVSEAVEKNKHADEGVAIVTFDVDDEDIAPRSIKAENFARSKEGITITQDNDGNIVAVRPTGEVVAGGADAIGVSDPTDLAEILEELDSSVLGAHPSITFADVREEGVTSYEFKSQCSLDSVYAWHGPGKNRVNIQADSSLAGLDVVTVSNPTHEFILRMDSLKFNGGSSDKPARWFNFDGVSEILLTNCEFRDVTTEGIRAVNNHRWNYVTNCWFLNGAGFTFDGMDDVAFVGNRIYGSGTTGRFQNCQLITGLGTNIVANNASLEGVGNTNHEPQRILAGSDENEKLMTEAVVHGRSKTLGYRDFMHVIEGIGTTAVTIADCVGQNVTWVVGEDDTGDEFRDHVTWRHFGTPTVSTENETGTPRSRTYSMDGNSLQLAVNDTSGTFDVVAKTNNMRSGS